MKLKFRFWEKSFGLESPVISKVLFVRAPIDPKFQQDIEDFINEVAQNCYEIGKRDNQNEIRKALGIKQL